MDRKQLNNLLMGGQGKSAEDTRNSAIGWGVCVVGIVVLTVVCLIYRM